jgi:hypothetical protein
MRQGPVGVVDRCGILCRQLRSSLPRIVSYKANKNKVLRAYLSTLF